jgi:outer membrane protein
MRVTRAVLMAAAAATALAPSGAWAQRSRNTRPGAASATQLPTPTAAQVSTPGPSISRGIPPALVGPPQSLRGALEQTYRTNPTLMAQREQLRVLDESVAVARSGLRPQVSGTVGLNQDLLTTDAGEGRSLSLGLSVSYPLFNAGRVRNSIRAADIRVLAGRADLRGTEADVFTDAVGSYMDVIRDRSIVELNENQVRVLQTNLQATRDRFEIGDLTRTDVAQSEARLSLAQSSLATAEGRLRSSEESYRRVVGLAPGELDPPPALPRLPATPDEAEDVSLENNPDLIAIAEQVRAAGYDVEVLRADRLPTVNAVGSGSYLNRLGSADEQFGANSGVPNDTTSIGIGVSARVPIYQGGLVAARVRQAQATQSRLLEQAIESERLVVARVRAAFSTYRASLEAIRSNEVAVAANQLALEGTRAEQTVGTRNVLDVLNAEQELLNSQVQLVTARRDAYVAGFQLLNAMGQAEADDLGLDGGALYNPLVHYATIHGRASDWSDDPRRPPSSTRTVPANADSPVTPLIGPVDPRTGQPPRTTPVTATPQ